MVEASRHLQNPVWSFFVFFCLVCVLQYLVLLLFVLFVASCACWIFFGYLVSFRDALPNKRLWRYPDRLHSLVTLKASKSL